MSKLFIISGSSGVGKGTIINRFLSENPSVKLSISTTTRTPRSGEIHGVHYFYVTKENFKKSIQNEEFLEWANFSENYYGTKKDFVKECLKNNQDLILEIDTQGALQVKEQIPEAILIFIAPPTIEILEQRLIGRKTEEESIIKKRIEFVHLEQENSKKYDYTIINDKLETAISELKDIVEKERKWINTN